jgi:hypothetical protein
LANVFQADPRFSTSYIVPVDEEKAMQEMILEQIAAERDAREKAKREAREKAELESQQQIVVRPAGQSTQVSTTEMTAFAEGLRDELEELQLRSSTKEHQLSQENRQLSQENQQLSQENQQLSQENRQLSQVIQQLSQENHTLAGELQHTCEVANLQLARAEATSAKVVGLTIDQLCTWTLGDSVASVMQVTDHNSMAPILECFEGIVNQFNQFYSVIVGGDPSVLVTMAMKNEAVLAQRDAIDQRYSGESIKAAIQAKQDAAELLRKVEDLEAAVKLRERQQAAQLRLDEIEREAARRKREWQEADNQRLRAELALLANAKSATQSQRVVEFGHQLDLVEQTHLTEQEFNDDDLFEAPRRHAPVMHDQPEPLQSILKKSSQGPQQGSQRLSLARQDDRPASPDSVSSASSYLGFVSLPEITQRAAAASQQVDAIARHVLTTRADQQPHSTPHASRIQETGQHSGRFLRPTLNQQALDRHNAHLPPPFTASQRNHPFVPSRLPFIPSNSTATGDTRTADHASQRPE